MSIIVLIFLLIIISSIFLFSNKNILRPGKFGRRVKRSKAGWIVGVYFAVLLISLIVLYILPGSKFVTDKSDNRGNHVYENMDDIYNAVKEHRVDSSIGIFTTKSWNFEFSDKELVLSSPNMINFDVQIIKEEKTVDDNKIEINEYTKKTFFNGIDFSDRIKSTFLELKGSRLEIIQPERYTNRLMEFGNGFTVSQFTKSIKHNNNLNIVYSPKVLHIRVPKGVMVTGYNMDIRSI